jgi:hypothetical protein
MLGTPATPASQQKWAGRVAAAWATIMLATELKVSLPYVHWVVSGLAIVVTLPYLRNFYRNAKFPARTPAWLLVVAVCIPVLYGARFGYSLAEAVKLGIILVGGISVFVARPYLAHCAFRGFLIAVCVNLVLFLGGYFGLGWAEEMGLNRWGTVLCWPGSLWRVASSVWVYAAYLVIKRRSLTWLGVLAGATLLVYFDGSRTALLLLLVGALYLVLVLAAEAGHLGRAILVGVMGIGLVVIGIAYSGVLSEKTNAAEGGAVGRAGEVVASLEASGVEGVGATDLVRYQMLQDVTEEIRAHPILGTGIESTVADTVLGPMSTHMSYLQVWADLGVLGVLAYVWLMWGWVVWVPRALKSVRKMPDPYWRAIHYNALYLLLLYSFAALFHPLSTEWSEWIIFIVPYALVCNLVRPSSASSLSSAAIS